MKKFVGWLIFGSLLGVFIGYMVWLFKPVKDKEEKDDDYKRGYVNID